MTIDYDSHLTGEATRSMDLVLADGYGPIEDAGRGTRSHPGFRAATPGDVNTPAAA